MEHPQFLETFTTIALLFRQDLCDQLPLSALARPMADTGGASAPADALPLIRIDDDEATSAFPGWHQDVRPPPPTMTLLPAFPPSTPINGPPTEPKSALKESTPFFPSPEKRRLTREKTAR